MFRVDEFRALIPDVIEHMDEPVGDQAMLPLFALARAAVKEVKVVLSGEGADELFAGYSYYGGRSADTNRVFFDDREQTASGFPAVLPKSVRQRLSPDTGAWAGGWHEELLADMLAVRDPLRRESFCDIATWLSEDLLMKADKMTMANSLEGRAPYLSPAVAEAAFNLPAQDKIAGGTVKVLLRAAAKNHLPRSILTRCKQGWVLPMEKWLRVNLHDEFIDAIRACDEPLLDRASMETLVREDRSGRGASIGGRALYALMVMVRWLNHADQKLAEHRRQLRAESPPDVLPEPVSPRWA
jgi:asparagine synthase (glutamine-hydrolysing)